LNDFFELVVPNEFFVAKQIEKANEPGMASDARACIFWFVHTSEDTLLRPSSQAFFRQVLDCGGAGP
jgi:hypothetical protein